MTLIPFIFIPFAIHPSPSQLASDIEAKLVKERLRMAALQPSLVSEFRHGLDGASKYAAKLRTVVDKAAADESRAPILIFGEPGLMKPSVASVVHYKSAQRDRPVIRIDAGQPVLKLLFGDKEKRKQHAARAAALTVMEAAEEKRIRARDAAAAASKNGKGGGEEVYVVAADANILEEEALEAAEGVEQVEEEAEEGLLYWLGNGTLILNDAHLLDATVQPRVRELLLDRHPEAPRIILASDKPLPWIAETGTVEITVPPLRLRPADISAISKHFLAALSMNRNDKAKYVLTPAAERRLRAYSWVSN